MIRFIRKLAGPPPEALALTINLTWEQRQHSRLLVALDDGREVGLLLPRGTPLRDGDVLQAEDGQAARVVAAPETLSCVDCPDALSLARAAYHLGNRHVPVQIDSNGLRYPHDHVLDDLVRGLGLAVRIEEQPFEPEPGAYRSGASGHSHHRHADH
ncbi:urease accessory protein UreE [Thiocystis violascens]|uniref:Urease accessory protein UreE n=1 Tax=Thiocystis violascens (strain ATCC 17096 / DSM 198 / 6111) TaxID=765911 RepID=I3YAL7_THIV6|nr:urease accessory protein UreE [Thiocystis violascens]AFL74035.1 urease accessory protein UreE [Thiocystis violascens DSM 198]